MREGVANQDDKGVTTVPEPYNQDPDLSSAYQEGVLESLSSGFQVQQNINALNQTALARIQQANVKKPILCNLW